MNKYDIGDIIIHHCCPFDDGYYLVEDIKTSADLNKDYKIYALRDLLTNQVADHSIEVIDELNTIEKIA